jgi:transcription factor SPN1
MSSLGILFTYANHCFRKLPVRSTRPANSQAAVARAKALEAPRAYQRARMEAGPTTYTVVPKSNLIITNESGRRSGGAGDDIIRKLKARRGGR